MTVISDLEVLYLIGILVIVFGFGFVSGLFNAPTPTLELSCDTRSGGVVEVINIKGLESIPQGSEYLCSEGLFVQEFSCSGCSWWISGDGVCAVKK